MAMLATVYYLYNVYYLHSTAGEKQKSAKVFV